jgi:hypothetical protein
VRVVSPAAHHASVPVGKIGEFWPGEWRIISRAITVFSRGLVGETAVRLLFNPFPMSHLARESAKTTPGRLTVLKMDSVPTSEVPGGTSAKVTLDRPITRVPRSEKEKDSRGLNDSDGNLGSRN